MSGYFSLEPDFQDIYNELGEYKDKEKQITRYILSNIARITKNKVKKDYNLYLHKDTNNLYRHIKSRVKRSASTHNDVAIVLSDASSANGVHYPFVLASGAEIKPKEEDGCLTFQIDGKWIRKHSVTIPERDFMGGPAKKYLGSSEMKNDMEIYLQKKLDKLAEQAAKKGKRK